MDRDIKDKIEDYASISNEAVKALKWVCEEFKRLNSLLQQKDQRIKELEELSNQGDLSILLNDFIKNHYKENPYRKGANDRNEIDDFLRQKGLLKHKAQVSDTKK